MISEIKLPPVSLLTPPRELFFEPELLGSDPLEVPEVDHEQGFKPGASVFLYARSKRDGLYHVLLAHNKKKQMWSSAGGYVDEGETFAQAGARELYEETGRFYGFDHKNNEKGLIPVLPKELSEGLYSVVGVSKGKALHYTFFVQVKYIASHNAILNSILNPDQPKQFNEMDSFIWVPLQRLAGCLAQATKYLRRSGISDCTYRRPVVLKTGRKELRLNGAFVRSMTAETAWNILTTIR